MNNNNNNNNKIIEIQQRNNEDHQTLKRRWHDSFYTRLLTSPNTAPSSSSSSSHILQKSISNDRDFIRKIIPSVTVVLEGRSICQRVNLHNHESYESLAKSLRLMFKDILNFDVAKNRDFDDENKDGEVDSSIFNAIPGYVVAYEDLENDLLLAGDLHWKDFVRVARRIRILPAKSKLRNGKNVKH